MCIAITSIIFCSFHFHFILICSFAFTFSNIHVALKWRTIIEKKNKKHKKNERKERGKWEEKGDSATPTRGEL